MGRMTFMGLLQVLAATQQGDSCAAVRLQALSALRAHLGGLAGGAADNGETADAVYAWAAAAMQAMVPPAAAHAHLLLEQQRQSVAEDMQVCCLALCGVECTNEWSQTTVYLKDQLLESMW